MYKADINMIKKKRSATLKKGYDCDRGAQRHNYQEETDRQK